MTGRYKVGKVGANSVNANVRFVKEHTGYQGWQKGDETKETSSDPWSIIRGRKGQVETAMAVGMVAGYTAYTLHKYYIDIHYICMHVCMYVCMYVYMHVHANMHKHTHILIL